MDVKKRYNLSEITSSSVFPMSKMNPNDDSSNDASKDRCNTKENTSVSFIGTFYLFLSCLSTGFISVIVKKIPYVYPTQLALIRLVGIFVGALPMAVYNAKEGLSKRDAFLLLVRGCFFATSQYAMIIAYRNMPIAEVAAVFATKPVVTSLLARLLLKESCGLVLLISLMINILGVLISLQIPEIIFNRNNVQISSQYLIGLAAAFSVVVFHALRMIIARKVKDVHYSVQSLCTSFVGILECAVINAAAFAYIPLDCGWEQILYTLIGVFGFMCFAWFYLAVQKQFVAIVAIQLSSFDLIISAVFQILFFQEYPDISFVCGACLVFISLGIIGLKTWLLRMPQSSSVRKKFKYFLH